MKSFFASPSRTVDFLAKLARERLILLTGATVLLFIALWWWLPAPFTLTFPIRTSRAVQLKLYYAGGDSGYREDRCTVRFADSRSAFKSIRLPIPRSNLRALRLHVSPGAVVDLGQIVLAPLGRHEIAIRPSEISIFNNSCRMEQQGSITRFQTAADSDGFDLDLTSSQLPMSNARRLETAAVILLCCLLGWLVWTVAQRQFAEAATKSSRVRDYRLSATASRRIVAGLTLALLLATLLRLNGSSTPIWRFYADGRLPDDGLLLGSAKDIRSDEWMVQTPWILSQAASNPSFPTTNPNVGDQATSLLVNLPIRHWTTIFRPQFWSFFVVDIEHAFSWYWNLKWYVVIVGGFLFFRSISRANALATFAGTILVFFAPYIQWWYSTGADLPETVGMTFIGLWALRCLLRTTSAFSITGAAILTLVAIENFIFCCYPRFQIPLLYFAALIAVWLFITSPPRPRYRVLRCACLVGVLALVSWCGFVWFGEVAATLRMTSQLEYPGKVFSVGGGYPWAAFLTPFLQFGMTEFHYPIGLVNACNAAGFILLLPFIVVLLANNKAGRRDLFVLLMLGFLLAVGYFMMVGIPAELARYSGWSLVYSSRAALPVGIASIACVVRLFAWPSGRRLLPAWLAVGTTAVLTAALWFCLSAVNQRYEGFVSGAVVVAVSAYLSATALLFFCNNRTIAVALLLVPTVAATGLINPFGRGLPGFYHSETFHWLQPFTAKDSGARWLIVGGDSRSGFCPYLVKAAGGDVLGGIRNNPDMRVLSVLDPDRKYFDVWNRFAIISYVPSTDGNVGFKLTSGVSYTVSIPFNTEWLDRLGVRYLLNVDSSAGTTTSIPGFETVSERDGLLLQRRVSP